jgi:hypothetical protein
MSKVNLPPKDEVAEKAGDALSHLIVEQGITPTHDLDELAALWPIDDDPDASLSYVLSERQARLQLDAGDQQLSQHEKATQRIWQG